MLNKRNIPIRYKISWLNEYVTHVTRLSSLQLCCHTEASRFNFSRELLNFVKWICKYQSTSHCMNVAHIKSQLNPEKIGATDQNRLFQARRQKSAINFE